MNPQNLLRSFTFSNRQLLGLSLSVALILGGSTGLFSRFTQPDFITLDAFTYIEAAKLWMQEASLHPTRPLLIALWTALPSLFTEQPSTELFLWGGFLLNTLAWLLSISLLQKSLVKMGLSQKFSFFLTLFYALSPSVTAFTTLLLSENLFLLLLISSLYHLIYFHQQNKQASILWAWAILGIAILVRPGILYFWMLFTLWMAYKSLQIRFRGFTISSFIFALLVVGLLSFQVYQMQQQYGNATVSYIDKVTWYFYISAQIQADEEERPYKEIAAERREKYQNFSWARIHQHASADLKYLLITSTPELFHKALGNLWDNAKAASYPFTRLSSVVENPVQSLINQAYALLSRLQNLLSVVLTVALGLLFLARKLPNHPIIGFSVWFGAYTLITSSISFWQGDRFNLVLFPLVVLMFGLLYKSVSTKNRPNHSTT